MKNKIIASKSFIIFWKSIYIEFGLLALMALFVAFFKNEIVLSVLFCLAFVLTLYIFFVRYTQQPQIIRFYEKDMRVQDIYEQEDIYVKYSRIRNITVLNNNLVLKSGDGQLLLRFALSKKFTKKQIQEIQDEINTRISDKNTSSVISNNRKLEI